MYCQKNQLAALDISHNPDLQRFICSDNQLTNLDVSHNPDLVQLWCSNNQLTSLDLDQNAKLKDIDCNNNQLTSLDVSRMVDLEQLRCNQNQLTSLDVSNNKKISGLECGYNLLTSLDLGPFSMCNWLYCPHNQLTDLNVSGCLCLGELTCDNNLLTSLDLSKCTVLNFSGKENPDLQIKIMGTNSQYHFDRYPVERIDAVTPEVVDLGLSVNWGSFNLWATCPEEEGAYYAWGEVDYNALGDSTVYKSSFDWKDYMLCEKNSVGPDGVPLFTKYCYDPLYGIDGFTDDLLILEEEDDAASVLLEDGWRIPTAEEWEELVRNCKWEYNEVNGVPGIKVTSMVPGYTDRSIFFPKSGRIEHGSAAFYDFAYYWSSSLKSPDNEERPSMACACEIVNGGGGSKAFDRAFGCNIRPVKPKNEGE